MHRTPLDVMQYNLTMANVHLSHDNREIRMLALAAHAYWEVRIKHYLEQKAKEEFNDKENLHSKTE